MRWMSILMVSVSLLGCAETAPSGEANGLVVAFKLVNAPANHGRLAVIDGYVVSYKKSFDPRVRGYDMIWTFLRGRRKQGGSQSADPVCR